MAGEVWKPIPGYEDIYAVSSMGRVRGNERTRSRINRWGRRESFRVPGKILKNSLMKNGYYRVTLHKDDGLKGDQFYIHHLVLLAFVGNRPAGMDAIRHLDGNRINNALSNLKYGTAAENVHDTMRHGKAKGGRPKQSA